MNSPRSILRFSGAFLATGLIASSAFAQSVWTGLGSDDSWSNDANWLTGIAPLSLISTALQFNGSTGLTPDADSPWTVGSIAFNSGAGAFTLGGSALTLADGGTVTNNSTNLQTIANSSIILGGASTWSTASGNLSVSSVISGGSLTKTGTSTLTLTGTNDYAGGTVINGGTLRLGSASGLGAATADLAVNAGGTLDLGGQSTTVGGLSGGAGGAIINGVVTTATLAVNQTANTIFAGNITNGAGTVVLVKTGAGTLELSGAANDFTTLAAYGGNVTSSGTTTLGTLVVGAFGAPGTSGDFSLTGGTLNTSKGASNTTYIGGGAGNTGTMTISGGTLNVGLVSAPGTRADFETGSFGGNGTVTQTGGALALNSTSGLFQIGNQGTGVYNLEAGTITVQNAFALGRSNASGLGNGTLNISGGSLTLSSSTKGALLVGGVDGTGAVNGGTGLIHQTGGTITVGQYMEFGPHGGSGTYDLLGGTLEIGGANGIRSGSAGSTYAFNLGAGTLKVVGSDLTTSVRANLVLGAAATILDTQGFNATWSGGFNGSGGALVKIGTGTLTLSTADSSFGYFDALQGTTVLASGTTSSGEFIVGGYAGVGGAFTMSGGQLNIGAAPIGGGTPSLRIGDFGGTGTFTQTGGMVDVNNASGASMSVGNQGGVGTYAISSGTLHLGVGGLITLGRSTDANPAGNGTFNVSGNALLDLEGGRFIVGDDTTSTNNGYGVVNQTGGTVRVGSGATLFLSGFAPTNGGTNTYNLSGGVLQVGGTSLKGVVNTPSPYNFNLGGGTIQVLGSDLSTTVNITLVSGTSSTVDTNGMNATLSGSITGANAQFVKAGAGNLALTAASNAIDSFFVTGGNVNQAAGKTLTSYEIGVGSGSGLTGSYTMTGGSLILAAGTPPPLVGGTASSFRIGDFGGTGTFTQTGGMVTVNGSMNIGNQGGSGIYNLSGGTLSLGGGLHDLGRTTGTGTASSGTLNLSGGLLELTASTARLILGDREGAGLQGTGVLTQTGGILRVTAGDLWLSSRGNGTYNLNGGSLEVGGNGLQTFYQGTGSGTGTYAFNLGGGTIKVIGADLTTSANATLTSGTSSTIDTNGLNATLSGTITGTNAQFVKAGIGNLALTAASNPIDSFFVTGGNVNQTAGSTLTSYEIGVGSGIGSTGSYTMSGGSLVTAAGTPPPLVGGLASSLRIGDFGGTGTFTQTGGTVTVNGSLNVGNQGGHGTYDLSAGTLNLASSGQSVLGRTSGSSSSSGGSTGVLNLSGTGVLNVTDTAKLVLSNWYPALGITQGNGTLTQTGGTLAVANTAQLILTGFGTGTYNLNGGTLQIGGATSLQGVYNGESGTYHFNLGGGTIQVAGSDLTTSVDTTLTSGTTSTVDTNGLNATFNGAWNGDGAIVKTGSGTMTLAGTNSYSGPATVNAGTLQLGNGGSLSWSGNVTLANGAALAINSSSDLYSQSNAITGTGSVIQAGTGLLQLTGSNTYNGVTAIRSGVLEVFSLGNVGGGASALGSPTTAANGTIALGYGPSTGTLRYSGNSAATTNRNIDLAGTTGGGVLEMDAGNVPGVTFTGNITSSGVGAKTLTLTGSNQGNISGVISGAETSVRVDGGDIDYAIWKLTGNNTFGGGVTIDHADLWFDSNSLGLGTTVDFYAGALVYNGTNTTDLSLRTVTLHSGSSTIDVGSNNVTFTQAIGNSGAGGFTKTGAGTLTVLGANTYTGATTVDQGVLSVSTIGNGGVASGIGAGGTAGSNLVLATGTLRYTGSGANTDRLFSIKFGSGTLDSSGTGALNFTNTGNISNDGAITTLTLAGSNTDNNTIAGSIVEGDNTLSLAKTGAGTWILNGTNSYTGSTTISNGILRLGPTGTLPSRPIIISATGAGATAWLDLNDRNATASSVTLSGSTATSSAKLTTGTGTLTLGGNVTFNATGNSLGATLSGNIALGGSTRTFNVGDSTNAPVDVLISAAVSGAGGLTKSGAGTLQLTGANTYTGQTLVTAGTVTVNTLANVNDGASSLGAPTSPANGTIGLGATTGGATLAYTGSSSTTDRILNLAGTTGGATLDASGTGPIAFTSSLTATGAGNKTLTLTGTNTGANTIGGAIVNNSGTNKTSVSKTGTGTWVLGGTSTYTGATTVTAGTLKVNGSIATSSLTTVSGTGILRGSGTVGPVTLASGGTISPGNSPGTLDTGAETWNGGASYVWEINKADGAKGADPGWDWLNISGTLDIAATTGSKFTISINTLTLSDVAGNATGFTYGQTYHWIIATASGGVANFSADKFLIDSSAFFNQQAANAGGFTITNAGNDLVLNLTYVPEPGTWAVGALLFLLILAKRRRIA